MREYNDSRFNNVPRDFDLVIKRMHRCKICGGPIEEGYFWYYLRYEKDESKSIAVCSKECLDILVKSRNYNSFEIYEYSRCTAYHKCEELGNLRGICETVENKTYQSIIPLVLVNHCQPAQAGTILSTHKLTEVLKDFSKQTEQQYLSNKEMVDQGAKESAKQFKITTWMTVLVIILTITNLVPMFLNYGSIDYFEQLSSIEENMDQSEIREELGNIKYRLTDIVNIISNQGDETEERIIELLEEIKSQLTKIE